MKRDALESDHVFLTYPKSWNKRIEALRVTYGILDKPVSRQQVILSLLASQFEDAGKKAAKEKPQ